MAVVPPHWPPLGSSGEPAGAGTASQFPLFSDDSRYFTPFAIVASTCAVVAPDA